MAHPAYQPVLNVKPANGSLSFTWGVPSTNLVLQQSADLTAASWSATTNVPVLNLTNLQYQVTVPATAGSGFFRLGTP